MGGSIGAVVFLASVGCFASCGGGGAAPAAMVPDGSPALQADADGVPAADAPLPDAFLPEADAAAPVITVDASPPAVDMRAADTNSPKADTNSSSEESCTPVASICAGDTTNQQTIDSLRDLVVHSCLKSGAVEFRQVVDKICDFTETCVWTGDATKANAAACVSCGDLGQKYERIVRDGTMTTDCRGCKCALGFSPANYFDLKTGEPNVATPGVHVVNRRKWDFRPGGAYDIEFTYDEPTTPDAFGHLKTVHHETRAIGAFAN